MATDIRVVVPTDLGSSIKLGAKVPNKYDVDLSVLELPKVISNISLSGTTLTIQAQGENKTVDLAPLMPAVVADVFLKSVTRVDNKLVFVVGAQGTTTNDNRMEVDLADLLPVQADGTTITGNGTNTSKLAVRISATTAGNLLKKATDGLYVAKDDLQTTTMSRDVRFVNASGTQVVGYGYSSES